MENYDTVQLLHETDKGVQMAIFSFDQMLEHIQNPALKKLITESRNDHMRLKEETGNLLKAYDSCEKEPGMMSKTMAWMETNWKTSMEDSDRVVADIVTKGCNSGTKNLYKYINQYAGADLTAAETAKKLIKLEENLIEDLRLYL